MLYKKIQIIRCCTLDNSINDGKYFNIFVIANDILKAQKIARKKFNKLNIPLSICESTSKVVVNNRLEDIIDCCYSIENKEKK